MFDVYVKSGKLYNLMCSVISEERAQIYIDGMEAVRDVLVVERSPGEMYKKTISVEERNNIYDKAKEAAQ
jgi:hypothetical protein